jgi:hypothetical protein
MSHRLRMGGGAQKEPKSVTNYLKEPLSVKKQNFSQFFIDWLVFSLKFLGHKIRAKKIPQRKLTR